MQKKQTEYEYSQEVVKPYRGFISETPVLLSLLYDANLLPEQATNVRTAISMVAVVVAYRQGVEAGKQSAAA